MNVKGVYSFKVKSCFSLKSKTPVYLISNVVYKYTCQCDAGVSYIGETKCHIIKRADEHISSINKFPYTAVGDHIGNCLPCQDSLSDGRFQGRIQGRGKGGNSPLYPECDLGKNWLLLWKLSYRQTFTWKMILFSIKIIESFSVRRLIPAPAIVTSSEVLWATDYGVGREFHGERLRIKLC